MNLPSPIPETLSSMLIWDAGEGVARHAGAQIELSAIPPIFPGKVVRALRYIPIMRANEIRESGQAWRPMLREERLACQAFLEEFAKRAFSLTLPGSL